MHVGEEVGLNVSGRVGWFVVEVVGLKVGGRVSMLLHEVAGMKVGTRVVGSVIGKAVGCVIA